MTISLSLIGHLSVLALGEFASQHFRIILVHGRSPHLLFSHFVVLLAIFVISFCCFHYVLPHYRCLFASFV